LITGSQHRRHYESTEMPTAVSIRGGTNGMGGRRIFTATAVAYRLN
jgi:hypothetical protein